MTPSTNAIKAHEDFSLTGSVLQYAKTCGFFGSRIVNVLTIPTRIFDIFAHTLVGAFTICGGSTVLGTAFDAVMWCAGSQKRSVLTLGGGFVNLTNAVHHAIDLIMGIFLGIIFDPKKAAEKFDGNQSIQIAELQSQLAAKELELTNLQNIAKEDHDARELLTNDMKGQSNNRVNFILKDPLLNIVANLEALAKKFETDGKFKEAGDIRREINQIQPLLNNFK